MMIGAPREYGVEEKSLMEEEVTGIGEQYLIKMT
jgi:hypothetical protein